MDKTDKNTIEELLPRYCEGLATEEERLQVEMWMDESEETGGWPNRYMLFILLQIPFTS